MKLFLISLLLGGAVSVQAQLKCSLGAFISPEVSNLTNVPNYPAEPSLTQTSGLLLSYDLPKCFGLTTGLWYSSKSHSDHINWRSTSPISIMQKVTNVHYNNYLEIPLLLNIKSGGTRRMGFHSSIGPVIGFPVGYSLRATPVNPDNTAYPARTSGTTLGLYAGIGHTVRIIDRLFALAEINGTYTPVQVNNVPDTYNVYYYSIGLRIGVMYRL